MLDAFTKKKQALIKINQRHYQHAARRLLHCEQELDICRRWEELYHQGILLQANLFRIKRGMKEVAIPDWLDGNRERLITLDPLLQPHEQISKIFRQSKKHKAAIPHLEKQIEIRRRTCKQYEMQLRLLEAAEDEEALQPFIMDVTKEKSVPRKNAKPAATLPYHEFYSAAGLAIRVGKGAKSNDLLTFSHSNGSDWWLHVRDFPGSHVVLIVPKGKEPDAESLQDAMHLALAHSKARDEKQAEITVTQCKYVNRLPGSAPGKVQLSKHKVMSIRQDAERLKKIKLRRPLHKQT